MTCPNCGAILDDRSQYCNHCGQAQQPPPPPDYQTFGDSAEGDEPHRRCYQQPTGDQNPRPVFNSTDGAPFGGERVHFILSICCFGWAGLVGLPKAISFLVTFFRWDWGNWGLFSWPPLSGWFSVAVHFVLPIVGGVMLLGMYKRNNA